MSKEKQVRLLTSASNEDCYNRAQRTAQAYPSRPRVCSIIAVHSVCDLWSARLSENSDLLRQQAPYDVTSTTRRQKSSASRYGQQTHCIGYDRNAFGKNKTIYGFFLLIISCWQASRCFQGYEREPVLLEQISSVAGGEVSAVAGRCLCRKSWDSISTPH